jgi:hypothetical protein
MSTGDAQQNPGHACEAANASVGGRDAAANRSQPKSQGKREVRAADSEIAPPPCLRFPWCARSCRRGAWRMCRHAVA